MYAHRDLTRGRFDYTREGGVMVKNGGGVAHLEGKGKDRNPGNVTGHWKLRKRQGSRFFPGAFRRNQPC